MFNTVDFWKSARSRFYWGYRPNSKHFKILGFLNMLDLRTPTPMAAKLGKKFLQHDNFVLAFLNTNN